MAFQVVLDIKYGITAAHDLVALLVRALGVQQLLPELAVVWVGGGLLNLDLLPVIGDLVDDPLGALAQLQVVECLNALRRDGDTGLGHVVKVVDVEGVRMLLLLRLLLPMAVDKVLACGLE